MSGFWVGSFSLGNDSNSIHKKETLKFQRCKASLEKLYQNKNIYQEQQQHYFIHRIQQIHLKHELYSTESERTP